MISLHHLFPWPAISGGIGLILLVASWVAIYLRVRHQFPDHPMAKANYFAPQVRDWNIGIRLVFFYFRNLGLDTRSGLLLVGLVMLLVAVVTSNVAAVKTLLTP
jgi:hypothetical protein